MTIWNGKKPSLLHLDMELTERCNNNCVHCYINLPAADLDARRNELSIFEIKKILHEASSLGCLDVCFTGGEPLLRDDFEEIYFFARRIGLRVMIVTNSTLITPSLTRLFNRIPPLRKIEVSVYGMDRESYESVSRVSGSFDAFQAGINLLLEHHVPFVARAALFPIGKEKLREFEAWASRIPWMDTPYAPITSPYLRCRGEQDARNADIKKMRLPPQQLLAVESRRTAEYIRGLRLFCANFCRIPGSMLFNCGAGMGKGNVDAYGNLQLCLILRHPDTVYSLKDGTIADALVNFFPRIRELQASDPLYLERCAQCFLRSLCEQCPAVSWLETRKIDGWLEYFCEFTHAQARFIGLLNEGELSWQVIDWKERVKNLLPVLSDENGRMLEVGGK